MWNPYWSGTELVALSGQIIVIVDPSISEFDFDILTYEISKTTEPIELKFSGVREGVNKLAVLKFQSNPISLRKNPKIWNSGKLIP